MSNPFTIRPAKPEESGLVLAFIKKLAVYEKCADGRADGTAAERGGHTKPEIIL